MTKTIKEEIKEQISVSFNSFIQISDNGKEFIPEDWFVEAKNHIAEKVSQSIDKALEAKMAEIREKIEGMIPTKDTKIVFGIDRDITKTTRESLVAMGYAQALKNLLKELDI